MVALRGELLLRLAPGRCAAVASSISYFVWLRAPPRRRRQAEAVRRRLSTSPRSLEVRPTAHVNAIGVATRSQRLPSGLKRPMLTSARSNDAFCSGLLYVVLHFHSSFHPESGWST